jgi:glycosyltransferase involved in cell wall biosynthesis
MRIDLVGPVPPSHGGISVYTARLYAELRRILRRGDALLVHTVEERERLKALVGEKRIDVVALPYIQATGSAICSMALAFHKPIVGSAIAGLNEGVVPGRTGILVPPGDPEALAAALIDFFTVFSPYESKEHSEELNRRLSWGALADAIDYLTTPAVVSAS